jgi:hypothetical protein
MKLILTDRFDVIRFFPQPSVIVYTAVSSDGIRSMLGQSKMVALDFAEAHTARLITTLFKNTPMHVESISANWLAHGDCVIFVERHNQIDLLFRRMELAD